jgi:hypothetical protein
MSDGKTPPVHVVAMHADEYSDEEKKSVVISLTTKYSGAQRRYSMPLACLHDLMMDLQRLHSSNRASSLGTVVGLPISPSNG